MKKILIAVFLLLLPANLFPTVVAWAGDDTKPAGKCETVTAKDPIPESLSDECYCKAAQKKYGNYKTTNPTISVRNLLLMTDRAFKCFVNVPPKLQSRLLTEDERISIVKKTTGTDLREVLKILPFSKYPPRMP